MKNVVCQCQLYGFVNVNYIYQMMFRQTQKTKLKPLQLGDVMVALINQQKTIDRTKQYRHYLQSIITKPLFQLNSKEQEQIIQLESMIMLPDFALVGLSQQQLLQQHIKHFFQKKNNKKQSIQDISGPNNEQIEIQHEKLSEIDKKLDRRKLIKRWQGITNNYEHLLEVVMNKHSKMLDIYHNKIKQGGTSLDEFEEQLDSTYLLVSTKRKQIKFIKDHFQNTDHAVILKFRRKKHLQQILYYLRKWKQNLPNILCPNSASSLNNNQFGQFKCFENIAERVRSHYASMSDRIQNEAQNCIMNFKDKNTYRTEYQQYVKYLQMKSGQKSQRAPKNVLEDIGSLVGNNIKAMYTRCLSQTLNSHLNNLQLLNQQSYQLFFQNLINKHFLPYLDKFHNLTSYHISIGTKYGLSLVKSRQLVVNTISQMIMNTLKYSNRFMHLDQIYRLKVLVFVYEFVSKGQQWMGIKLKLDIGTNLLNKIKAEFQAFYKTANGELKTLLALELSLANLSTTSTTSKKDNEQKNASPHLDPQDMLKVKMLLEQSIPLNPVLILELKDNKPINTSKQFDVQTECFKQFIKIKQTYAQKSNILPINLYHYMYQHLELLTFFIYKMSITDENKLIVNEDTLTNSSSQKLTKIITTIPVNMSQLSNNEIEKQIPSSITQLKQIYSRKMNYANLYEFLIRIGTKYEGISISGFLNVNKLYEPYNEPNVNNYYLKVVKIGQDMLSFIDGLLQSSNEEEDNRNNGEKRKCIQKIQALKPVIKELVTMVFVPHYQRISQKYKTIILPIFNSLKWEVKKFNQQTANLYKDYKIKIIEIYKGSRLDFLQKEINNLELVSFIRQAQIESLFKFLIDLYGKIDKINDNGRQLIRLDFIQINKMLGQIGDHLFAKNWAAWLERYLEYSNDRSSKNLIEKITKNTLVYPINSWKSSLVWVISDFSGKQKRQFLQKLITLYMNALKDALDSGFF